MALYHAEGIILHSRPIGEADRLVTLLCREQGKLAVIAKGARRPRSRFVGLTLPFNLLQLALFSGRGLDELSQAECIRPFQVLRDDLTLLAYASYLAELTAEFLPERQSHPEVFALLVKGFAGLEADLNPEALTRHYELRLLDLLGYRPVVETCLACGCPLIAAAGFAPSEGGFYCGACVEHYRDRKLIPLTPQAINGLAAGLAGKEDFLLGLAAGDRRAVRRTLRAFIEVHLERELKSLRFLEGICGEDDIG